LAKQSEKKPKGKGIRPVKGAGTGKQSGRKGIALDTGSEECAVDGKTEKGKSKIKEYLNH
jgi:hypothetical protein